MIVFKYNNLQGTKIVLSGEYQFGILKMVGPKKQDFWPKINVLKGNHCILRIRGAPVLQKLGMLIGNKVLQKCFFYKKWSPKLIFLNKFNFEKNPLIFVIEN